MGSLPPSSSSTKKPLLCWTILGCRKPGMSEEEYHAYMSETHAPLLRDLMIKHGVIKWSINHNTTATRDLMSQFAGPDYKCAEYDAVITAYFPDIQTLVGLKNDPRFKAEVSPDHKNFADEKRSGMTIGWVENYVVDGKAV